MSRLRETSAGLIFFAKLCGTISPAACEGNRLVHHGLGLGGGDLGLATPSLSKLSLRSPAGVGKPAVAWRDVKKRLWIAFIPICEVLTLSWGAKNPVALPALWMDAFLPSFVVVRWMPASWNRCCFYVGPVPGFGIWERGCLSPTLAHCNWFVGAVYPLPFP